jgi:hypothetical protein
MPVLHEFKTTLEDFVSRLRAALPQPETAIASPAPLVAEQAKQVIAEMIRHLSTFDAAAGDCLETNQDVFRSLLGSESFATLKQQMDRFAFADARAVLQEAAKKKGLLPA